MLCLGLTALCATLAFTGASVAQGFPDRPVTLIVPFPAGGPADGLARAFAEGLELELGQSIIVDNRPGGGTMAGLSAAACSEPDGDHAAGRAPYGVSGARRFRLGTVGDLIERARDNPGGTTFASTGHGAATHITGEYFASMAGSEMVHVPYQGSAPAVVDLLGGRVDMLVDAISGALGYMETGELYALATTSAERSSITPDIPAANETLEGFDARSFIGLFGPGGLPQDVRNRLHEASAIALEDAHVAERSRARSMDVVGLGPAEFG
ncbi:MAG: hypothetical protein JJT95_05415 [Pararhodobacter sp.]|nr:hypothetical protein [Pararhodobacter sp.]